MAMALLKCQLAPVPCLGRRSCAGKRLAHFQREVGERMLLVPLCSMTCVACSICIMSYKLGAASSVKSPRFILTRGWTTLSWKCAAKLPINVARCKLSDVAWRHPQCAARADICHYSPYQPTGLLVGQSAPTSQAGTLFCLQPGRRLAAQLLSTASEAF
jgi:hypothetical protein